VRSETETIKFRAPLKFGGRVVTDSVLLNVTADVETRDGRRGQGRGSMPMSNAWAWPSPNLPGDQTLSAMIDFGEQAVAAAADYKGTGHPMEITHDLSREHARLATRIVSAMGLEESMPRLARLVSASPVEAAIHDAYGRALGANSYNVLSAEFVNRD